MAAPRLAQSQHAPSGQPAMPTPTSSSCSARLPPHQHHPDLQLLSLPITPRPREGDRGKLRGRDGGRGREHEGGREGKGRREGGREGGREGRGVESASPHSVEFRRPRVKVADCCRVLAARILGCFKSLLSPGAAKKGDRNLETDHLRRGRRVGFWQHLVQVVLRRCRSQQRQERQAFDAANLKSSRSQSR